MNRDFTVNALLIPMDRMALCWDRNDIIDYVGGLEDVENGVIRIAPQSTVDQILTASPIRILRAIKYCLDFGDHVEEELYRGMKEYGHLLETVSYSVIQLVFITMIEANRIEQMLRMMEDVNLNAILCRIIVGEPVFCRTFLNVISALDQDVQSVFVEFGYPTVWSVEDECIPRALKERIKNKEEMKETLLSVIEHLIDHFDDN